MMDPLLITLLLLAGSAATSVAVLQTLFRRLSYSSPPQLLTDEQDEEQPAEDPIPENPHEEESSPEDTHQQESEDSASSDDDSTTEPGKSPLEKAIDALTRHIVFANQRRFVGYSVIDERAVGVRSVESLLPQSGYSIRPIAGFDEIDLLLPEELAHEDDLFFKRVFLGEALVMVPMATEAIMEPVHEEVYEDVVQVLYVLLDVSGSMSEEWRVPIWKGVARRLIHQARESGANVILRLFNESLGEPRKAEQYVEYDQLMDFVGCLDPRGGTDIGRALSGATLEIGQLAFDTAQIVIISDGEDEGFQPAEIRAVLDRAEVQLHAIMIGVDNTALRACADLYQIVEPGLVVRHPVRRK